MGQFADTCATRLPSDLELPSILRDLFDWIEDRGWVTVGGDGEGYGRLGQGWHDGTNVTFVVMDEEQRRRYLAAWTNNDNLSDILIPFAETGAEGSKAAWWRDDNGKWTIVHMGSGSGSTLACRLCDNAEDFLRLLAVGYDEVCWLDRESVKERPVLEEGDDWSPVNIAFREWITSRGLTVPETAAEIVPKPVCFQDDPSDDRFAMWLGRVTG